MIPSSASKVVKSVGFELGTRGKLQAVPVEVLSCLEFTLQEVDVLKILNMSNDYILTPMRKQSSLL